MAKDPFNLNINTNIDDEEEEKKINDPFNLNIDTKPSFTEWIGETIGQETTPEQPRHIQERQAMSEGVEISPREEQQIDREPVGSPPGYRSQREETPGLSFDLDNFMNNLSTAAQNFPGVIGRFAFDETYMREKLPSLPEGFSTAKDIRDLTAQRWIEEFVGIDVEDQSEFMGREVPTSGDETVDAISSIVGQTGGSLTRLIGTMSMGSLAPLGVKSQMGQLPSSIQRMIRLGTGFTASQAVEDITHEDRDYKPRDYAEALLSGMAVGGVGGAAGETFRELTTNVPINETVYPFVEKIMSGVSAGAARTGVQKAFRPEEIEMKDLGLNMASMAILYSLPLLDPSKRVEINNLRSAKQNLDLEATEAFKKLGLDKSSSPQQVKSAWDAQKTRVTRGDLKGLPEQQKLQFLSDTKNARETALNYIDDIGLTGQAKNLAVENLNKITNSMQRIFANPENALVPTEAGFTPQSFNFMATPAAPATPQPAPATPQQESQEVTRQQQEPQPEPTPEATPAPEIRTDLPDNIQAVETEIQKMSGILQDAGDMANEPEYQPVREYLSDLEQQRENLLQREDTEITPAETQEPTPADISEPTEVQQEITPETEGVTPEPTYRFISKMTDKSLEELTPTELEEIYNELLNFREEIANRDTGISDTLSEMLERDIKAVEQIIKTTPETEEVVEPTPETGEVVEETVEPEMEDQEITEQPQQEVELNFTQEDLTNVRGIGPSTAQAIMEYVNQGNTIDSPADLYDLESVRNSNISRIDKESFMQLIEGQQEIETETQEPSVGYHAGDLGKAESMTNMESSRGTGHFGTGTYFVGDQNQLDYERSSYTDRPMHEIDFSNYDLYRPSDRSQGFALHDLLRDVNRYALQGEFATEEMSLDESRYKPYQDEILELKDEVFPEMPDEDFLNKLEELNKYAEENRYDPMSGEPRPEQAIDTPSTKFMKDLGYEGIDVTGIEGLDNTEYGSVIYDLHEEDLPTQPAATIDEEQIDFAEEALENQIEEWEVLDSEIDELTNLVNEETGETYSPEAVEQARENYINRRLEQLPDQNELIEDMYRTGVEFTDNISEALWLFPNGTMVDGQFDMGSRGLDHRIISSPVLDNDPGDGQVFWHEVHDKYNPIRLTPETMQGLIKENQPITDTQQEIMEQAGYETEVYLEDDQPATEDIDTTDADTQPVETNLTEENLSDIRGIGPATIEKIQAHLDAGNDITSYDDLQNVEGLSNSTISKINTEQFNNLVGQDTGEVDTTDTANVFETVDVDKPLNELTPQEAIDTRNDIENNIDSLAREDTDTTELINDAREDLEIIERHIDSAYDEDVIDDLEPTTEELDDIDEDIARDMEMDADEFTESTLDELTRMAEEEGINLYSRINPSKMNDQYSRGEDLSPAERALQTPDVKNKQLANRLEIDHIPNQAIADVWALYNELDATGQWSELNPAETGMLGYYMPDSKESGVHNVRDVETLTHEIGHAVDRNIFGEFGENQDIIGRLTDEQILETLSVELDMPMEELSNQSKEFLNQEAENLEQNIRSEMAHISQKYIRPTETDEFYTNEYRQSTDELIADFWSAYLLNPGLARDLAPNASRMYDQALMKPDNAGLRNIVESVRERLAMEQTDPNIQFKLTTPEQARVLNPLKGEEYSPRRQAQEIAARTEYMVQWHKTEADLNIVEWAEVVPEEIQEDIPFYIEGTGNPLTGKSYEQIAQEIEGDPEIRRTVRQIQFEFEKVRQDLNETLIEADDDLRISYLENYVPRMWETPDEEVRSFYEGYGTQPRAAQARKIPTIVEGIESGLTPETTNILALYKNYIDLTARPIAKRAFRSAMFDLQDENGNPVVLTDEEFMDLRQNNEDYSDIRRGVGSVERTLSKVPLKENIPKTKEYVPVQSNVLQPHDTPVNKTYYVRRDTYEYAREHFETRIDALEPVSKVNNLMKGMNYLGSLFHAVDFVFESGVGGFHFTKPLKNMSGSKFHDSVLPWEKGLELSTYKPFIRTAIYSGLNVSPMAEANVGVLADFTEYLVNKAEEGPVPGADKPIKGFQTFQDAFQGALWGKLFTGSKVNSFYGLLEKQNKFLPDNPTDAQIRAYYETAADQVNQMYGGQDWARSAVMSPQIRQVSQLFIRAADWTLSNVKMGSRLVSPHVQNIMDYGISKPDFDQMTPEQQAEDTRRKLIAKETKLYWGKIAIGMGLLINGLNYALNGHFSWENPNRDPASIDVTDLMHNMQRNLPFMEYDEDDNRRYYVQPLKQAREVLRMASEPINQIGYKVSPFVQMVLEQANRTQPGTGYPMEFQNTDRMDAAEVLLERGKAAGRHFAPFALSGSSFALSLPMRRGISEYHSILRYENIIENMIDPTITAKIFNEDESERAVDLIREIDRQVLSNGHNPIELNNHAIGNLKTKYGKQLADAIEEGDIKKAEEAAIARHRLLEFDVGRMAEGRGMRYSDEAKIYKLIQNKNIPDRSQQLPNEILFPHTRFDSEEIEEILERSQRRE